MPTNRPASENSELPPAFLIPDSESFLRYRQITAVFKAVEKLKGPTTWAPSGHLTDIDGNSVSAFTGQDDHLLSISAGNYEDLHDDKDVPVVENIMLSGKGPDQKRIAISVVPSAEFMFDLDDISGSALGILDLYDLTPASAIAILASFDDSEKPDPTDVLLKAIRATLFSEIPGFSSEPLLGSGLNIVFTNTYGSVQISLIDDEGTISHQLPEELIPQALKNLPPLAFSYHQEKAKTDVHFFRQGVIIKISENEDDPIAQNSSAILEIFSNALRSADTLASIN